MPVLQLESVEETLVRDEEEAESGACSSRRRSRAFQRQAIKTALAVVSLVVCVVCVAALHSGNDNTADGVKADPSAVTGLQGIPQGGLLHLEVGTSARGYAQTNSPVTASFSVGGAWTPEEALFKFARRGEVVTADVMVPQWPTQLRLTIHGTDGYGMRFIRLTLNGEMRALLDSADGDQYGENQFWLDGDDNALPSQIYNVPGIYSGANPSIPSSSTGFRKRLIGVIISIVLIILLALWGVFYKDELLKLLGREGRTDGAAHQQAAPMFSQPAPMRPVR